MADDLEQQQTEKSPPVSRSSSFHPAFYIASWIFFSNITILFNKWLIDTAGFRYPVFLTCWHLVFATLATQILARTTHLLDGRKTIKMTGRVYLRAIVPIGLLYSASLVCSNVVYLYLSVAFIQMLKASAPVAVLFASWVWGVDNPSVRRLLNILLIVFGVALASLGEIHFSWAGFLFQLGGIVFEAVRLVMIQILLSEDGQKMDPLVSLYYYAPVCAVMNLAVAMASEWASFDYQDLVRTGPLMLLLNAVIAFMLNVSSVFLIGKTSGLVMTLTSIFKNIFLVIASVMIWQTSIAGVQLLGYGIALAGLLYYSLPQDQFATQSAAAGAWLKGLLPSPSTLDESRLSPPIRRAAVMGLALLVAALLTVGFFYHGGSAGSGGDENPVQMAVRMRTSA